MSENQKDPAAGWTHEAGGVWVPPLPARERAPSDSAGKPTSLDVATCSLPAASAEALERRWLSKAANFRQTAKTNPDEFMAVVQRECARCFEACAEDLKEARREMEAASVRQPEENVEMSHEPERRGKTMSTCTRTICKNGCMIPQDCPDDRATGAEAPSKVAGPVSSLDLAACSLPVSSTEVLEQAAQLGTNAWLAEQYAVTNPVTPESGEISARHGKILRLCEAVLRRHAASMTERQPEENTLLDQSAPHKQNT